MISRVRFIIYQMMRIVKGILDREVDTALSTFEEFSVLEGEDTR